MPKNCRILFISLFSLLMPIFVTALSASQINEKCHCDLTSSFCDFSCCCDTDCGSSITQACFYAKSKLYCPKTQFFKSIKPGFASNSLCYYYNASTSLLDQFNLTSMQRTRVISQFSSTEPVESTISTGYKGYQLTTALTIGDKTNFSFLDLHGNCLVSPKSGLTFNLKFGLNIKISCLCNNCGTPSMFSEIMGKSIPQFFSITGKDIKIPEVADQKMTTLRLNFIIGKYGSQKIRFISQVRSSWESKESQVKSLLINFIDSDTIQEKEESVPFFPQIPLDMFYFIHVMS